MSGGQQANHELRIFNQFIASASLSVCSTSTQNRQPPEPDILCSIEGHGDVAFELVQIIDESLARRDNDASRLHPMLVEAFKNFPDKKRLAFLSRYKHCSIFIAFQEKSAFKDRAAAVPAVLDLLLTASEPVIGMHRFAEFREDYEKIYRRAEFTPARDYVRVVFPQYRRSPLFLIKQSSPIRNALDWMNVSQSEHLQGPFFGVDAAGSFGESSLEAIRGKFEKKYSTSAPIELLAFYEFQPVLPAEFWLAELSAFVEQNIGSSPFRKVHVFDTATNQILYQFSIPEVRSKAPESAASVYWELTEESNALDYLEMAIRSLMEVEKNQWAWKWVCLALHGSLYGFAVCAIKGTDYSRVTYRDHRGHLKLIAFDAAIDNCQTETWMKQYVFSKTLGLTPDQKTAIDILKNDIRNRVEHYIPGSSFIELRGMPAIVSTYLDIIEFLAAESGNPDLRAAEKERVRALCEAGRKLALSTKIRDEDSN